MEPRAVFRTDGMFKAEMAAFAAVFSIIAWLLVRGAGMLRRNVAANNLSRMPSDLLFGGIR